MGWQLQSESLAAITKLIKSLECSWDRSDGSSIWAP
jgi:hypothetical protein